MRCTGLSRSATATTQVTPFSCSTTQLNLQSSASQVPKKRARKRRACCPVSVCDLSMDIDSKKIGTYVRVGNTFWIGQILGGPVKLGHIRHYQVAYISDVDFLKGWFPEDDLTVLGGCDDLSSVSYYSLDDLDPENGDDGNGDDDHQPPSNGRNYPFPNNGNNGANNPGANNSSASYLGESFSSSCSSIFGFSNNSIFGFSHSSSLPRVTPIKFPTANDHSMSILSSPEEIPSVRSEEPASVRSDRFEEIYEEIESDDPSEDAEVSDEEKSASDGEQEGDWAELKKLYSQVLIFSRLGEHPSEWQPAVRSCAAAPTESSCSRNDCWELSENEEKLLSAQLQVGIACIPHGCSKACL